MPATIEASTTRHLNLPPAKRLIRADLLPQPIKSLIVTTQTLLYSNLCNSLGTRGFEIDWQIGNHSQLADLSIHRYDLVLIGPTHSDDHAPQLWAELRRRTLAPIILLANTYQVDQHVRAVEMGMDRVITLPFETQTLMAHITALLRRTAGTHNHTQTEALSVGAIYLCHATHTVRVRNRPIELSPLDYRLLHYLMQRANYPVSKAELRRAVWVEDQQATSNSVEVAIRRLRNKIEPNPSAPQYLLTEYGTGYKLIHS